MALKQMDCFDMPMKIYKIMGLWPGNNNSRIYSYYSKTMVLTFIVFYNILLSVNFYFSPKILDNVIDELLFYFTGLANMSKVFTLLYMHDKIVKLFSKLESVIFQPTTCNGNEIVNNAKQFNVKYWKIVAAVSLVSHLTHVLLPLFMHLILEVELELPLCLYSFIPDNIKQAIIYPLYVYQCIGLHYLMWDYVNTDTLFVGLMVLTIAQLNILDEKLRNITNEVSAGKNDVESLDDRTDFVYELNQSLTHFNEVAKFCSLIQQAFSMTLFVQFGVASCIICVGLIRFTLPAPWQYFIFLATYVFIMIVIEIMIPCWFGTRILEKSQLLGRAVYHCDWISRSRTFKINLRLFVLRTQRPLSITGWKMFPLALTTFTSIMNMAYSFFTLLRNMQSRQ